MKLSIKTEFLWINSDLLLNYYTFLNAYILSKLTGLMKDKKTYKVCSIVKLFQFSRKNIFS